LALKYKNKPALFLSLVLQKAKGNKTEAIRDGT